MSETKAETVDLRDHPDWQTGDFTLITADGWRFKVWSHHLLTASDTFCEASKSPDPTVTFVDLEVESKPVIAFFARLISHPADKNDATIFSLDTHLSLIRLLRKYECQHTLDVYSLYLKAALMSDRLRPMEVWVLGAVLDDNDVCAAALRQETPQFQRIYWRAHCAHRSYTAAPQVFYISDLPVAVLSIVPPHHLHALDKVRRKNWDELVPESQRGGYSIERLGALNASQEYAEVVALVQKQQAGRKAENGSASPEESRVKRQRT